MGVGRVVGSKVKSQKVQWSFTCTCEGDLHPYARLAAPRQALLDYDGLVRLRVGSCRSFVNIKPLVCVIIVVRLCRLPNLCAAVIAKFELLDAVCYVCRAGWRCCLKFTNIAVGLI